MELTRYRASWGVRYSLRRFSTEFKSRWGRSVLEAALFTQLHANPRALNVVLNDGAIDLVALSQNRSRDEFLSELADLANRGGLDAASAHIADLYRPYTSQIQRIQHKQSLIEHTQPPISLEPVATSPNRGIEHPFNVIADPATLKPSDFESDDMDLFDPETWLKESPTAQRLWKEAEGKQ